MARSEPWLPLFKKIDALVTARGRVPCRTVYDPSRRVASVSMGDRSIDLMICPRGRYGDQPFFKRTASLVVCVAGSSLTPGDGEKIAAYLAAMERHDAALSAALSRLASSPSQPETGQVQPLIQDLSLRDGDKVKGKLCLLSLTMRCNQRCLFCPVFRDAPELGKERILKELSDYCARNSAHLPVTGVLITGGEPTLSPALGAAVRFMEKKGVGYCSLLSNAVRFADRDFVKAVFDAGVRRLFLSFHSHREETYDLLTGTTGLYPKAVEGLTLCLSMPFFEVTCNVVLTKHNYKDIPAMASFIAGLRKRSNGPKTLNMCVSAMNQNPRWLELSIEHSKAAPFLRRTCREGALPFTAFMGDCAMPVCVGGLYRAAPSIVPSGRVDTPTWRALRGWDPSKTPVPEGCLRVKDASCKKCRFDPVCGGLMSLYARRYGTSELRPVK